MALTALLFAYHGTLDGGDPWAMQRAGGVTLLRRQVRQAKASGATRVIVYAERRSAAVLADIGGAVDGEELVIGADALRQSLPVDGLLLVLDEGLVFDRQSVMAVAASACPVLGIWPSPRPCAERIDAAAHWAGIALVPAAIARAVAADLGEWDMASTLLRAAAAASPQRIDFGARESGGQPGMVWHAVRSATDGERLTSTLIETARAGISPEGRTGAADAIGNLVLTRLLERDAGAGPVAAAAGGAAALSVAAVAAGAVMAGLLLALLAGWTTAAARLLAAVRDEAPDWDRYVPHAMRSHDALLWLALAFHLAGSGDSGPWATAVLAILAGLSMDRHRLWLRRLNGGDGPPVLARLWPGRTGQIALVALAGIGGSWYAGLAAIALWSATAAVVLHIAVERQIRVTRDGERDVQAVLTHRT